MRMFEALWRARQEKREAFERAAMALLECLEEGECREVPAAVREAARRAADELGAAQARLERLDWWGSVAGGEQSD